MRPLLPMSCLTLINEGADTGGISESRGDAEARGHPRRRAGAGREKATATPPRPVGKGKGEAPARSCRRTGPPRGWAPGGAQGPGICRHLAGGPGGAAHLSTPLEHARPRQEGLVPNVTPQGTQPPCLFWTRRTLSPRRSRCHPPVPKEPRVLLHPDWSQSTPCMTGLSSETQQSPWGRSFGCN